ncbi:efflux transporter outer membrane subunit [Zhouia sp. PK063]|uniref:efflux transporter outer membrane subunit n=1 Tax=Zhouia sp. PK063 TaxID=3373602 RepID=UPI0037B5F5E9
MKISISTHKILLRVTILAGFAVTMQSCFVAKDYQRPEFEETSNLYRTDNLPQDSTSMAEVSWRDLFTDPYLTQYIEKGLENNLDIRIAVQQIMAAEAYVKQGKAGYLPSLSAGGTATRSYLSKNGQQGAILSSLGTDHVDQFELSGNLTWEADIWGKIRSNKRAYVANYLKTVAAHKAVKTQLIADIASTYYQLLALDAQLKVTQETVASREKSVETIKALKDAGQVNQVAVDQNAAQLYNAQALMVDLKTTIFKAENTLSILLGEAPNNFERGTLDTETLDTKLDLGVPALLLRNRPDVQVAEFNLVNAFELTNVARSNFYPSFTFSASGGLQSLTLDKLFDSSSFFATLVGGITQPIFNKRQIKTQYEVAKSQQEQAALNFEKTLLSAGKEVSDALYSYEASKEQYQYRLKEVTSLRKAEENSEELLNNGFGTYLDLLTARQSALSAELNVINNKLQQLTSVVTLYHALGGGWQ